MSARPVLEITDLTVEFASRSGAVRAVDGVSIALGDGEILALVGESGSGKSVTSLAAMRLLPEPPARIVAGKAMLGDTDLLAASERELRAIRGRDLAMIFQDPMSSLNPVLTIGRQITEAIALHEGGDQASLRQRAIAMLELVQIPEPARRVDEYPHQLSGGMRQRVMIALALSCGPRVLIADEPTTALDVTIQAQILALLADLRTRLGTSILLITHDLGVVAENADRVVVLYAGRKVEEGPVRAVLDQPLHPYTQGLLRSMPALGGAADGARLQEIPGSVPVNAAAMPGCAFAPRCPLADDHCRTARPPLAVFDAGRLSACWKSAQLHAQDAV
jgi:oligopeptide/dipeptide ABC transporter ATP-binding protein